MSDKQPTMRKCDHGVPKFMCDICKPAQSELSPAPGSASLNGLFVGAWCAETIWERAERARVFLRIMGYANDAETDSIGKRLRRDKTVKGMRQNTKERELENENRRL